MRLVFVEGINLRLIGPQEERPKKHQLSIEFDDSTALSAVVQMYGAILCFLKDTLDNPYYLGAKNKISPLSDAFDQKYFNKLLEDVGVQKLSAKAFLATEQRIPGLGNGVLQDILFNAAIHPKKKINTLTDEEKDILFDAVKSTLSEMTILGGRNTQKDLFGCSGGYTTKFCKNTVSKPCPKCSTPIQKANYMGGSIYFCEQCQKL